jgi:hypothetical protein
MIVGFGIGGGGACGTVSVSMDEKEDVVGVETDVMLVGWGIGSGGPCGTVSVSIDVVVAERREMIDVVIVGWGIGSGGPCGMVSVSMDVDEEIGVLGAGAGAGVGVTLGAGALDVNSVEDAEVVAFGKSDDATGDRLLLNEKDGREAGSMCNSVSVEDEATEDGGAYPGVVGFSGGSSARSQ